METTQDLIKQVLNVTKITETQIREMGRGYNPKEWDKIIDRFMTYGSTEFYLAHKQRGYDYDRYYAVYTTPEGLRLLNGVSYSSCLHNGGFCRITIQPNGEVYRTLFIGDNGEMGYAKNDAVNRKMMAKNSQEYGYIFANDF